MIYPRYCQWDITSKCNLGCTYCRAQITDGQGKDLSIKESLALIDALFDLGVRSFCLAGGEPFLHPQLGLILKTLRSKGATLIVILTNGTAVSPRSAELVGGLADRVQISMDGADKETMERARGSGTFEKVMRGFHLLKEAKANISLRMTCSTQTELDVIRMVELAVNIGAVEFDLRRVVPVARAVKEQVEYPSAEQYRKLCSAAWEAGKRYGIKIELGDPFPSLLIDEKVRRLAEEEPGFKDGSTLGGCSVGVDSIYIAPDGKLLLCPYLPLYCGDIKDAPLRTIWETSKALRFFRSIRYNLKGKCTNCKFLFACGGCRAVAYSITGDILAEDPGCWYQPAD